MSRVKPILFNTEMVRAILDGRKTVTRRLVKQAHLRALESKYHKEHPEVPDSVLIEKLCKPPYQPDDVIYVKETWARLSCRSCEGDNQGDCFAKPDKNEGCYMYRAMHEIYGDIKWHPSIYMPKEAARIWLRVTDVGVERLQDINERGRGSAEREGFSNDIDLVRGGGKSATKHFADHWDSIIKKSDLGRCGWAANPFVWVIMFERYKKPESEV